MFGKRFSCLDTIGVVTHTKVTADLIFSRIADVYSADIVKYIKSTYEAVIYFKDGTRILSVRPSDSSKGCRFSYAVIENGIDEEVLNVIIYPCFVHCEEDDVFFVEEAEDAVAAIHKMLEIIRKRKYEIAEREDLNQWMCVCGYEGVREHDNGECPKCQGKGTSQVNG